jgi:hypothetical protein
MKTSTGNGNMVRTDTETDRAEWEDTTMIMAIIKETSMTSTITYKVNKYLSHTYGDKHKAITHAEVMTRLAKGHFLGETTDAKTSKGVKKGYLTGILYLAPADISGYNVCPFASDGCRKACLFSAGRGKFYSVTRARIIKTLAYLHDKQAFVDKLHEDITRLIKKAKKKGMTPCVRLNGTSDLLWQVHHRELFDSHDVQFYDYTKSPVQLQAPRPDNYHLTYSYSDDIKSRQRAELALALGTNVAVVFDGQRLPEYFLGVRVIDGDDTDLRFLDEAGVVVGLKAKGEAKKDTTGFVQRVQSTNILGGAA